MTKSIDKSDLFRREGMNDMRTRDNKSVASNTTATTNSTMSTTHSEATSKSHKESKNSKKEKKQGKDKDKEKKLKSSSESKEKKSSKDKEKKKSKSDKPSKSKEGKKKNSSPSPTELEPTSNGKKNGIASFDAFDSFGFGDNNAFGENPAGENGSSTTPRKLRSRRRASVSGGDARSCHSGSDDGFASASEDEIASFDGTSLRETRTVPKPSHSSGSLDSPTAASKSKPRRRARRSSAVGNVSSSNSSFANSSFGQGSGASLDYGYEDHTTTKTGNASAAEQYGYEDQSATSSGFGSDFGNFGAGPGGGRRQATRRYSVGGGMGGGSDHGSKDGIVVEDVGEHQRKLIDDIAFGGGFDSNGGGGGGGGSSGGNNFMVPMADAAPQDNAGQNQRRPRRRTSLTLGGSFANHQVLDVDAVEAEKKQNKSGFFKDRSADRQKLSKNGAESTRAKNNENLTGYDFNRDRRRFMG